MKGSYESDHWLKQVRIGRLQLKINVWRHHYADKSHRWVVQPCVVWDVYP